MTNNNITKLIKSYQIDTAIWKLAPVLWLTCMPNFKLQTALHELTRMPQWSISINLVRKIVHSKFKMKNNHMFIRSKNFFVMFLWAFDQFLSIFSYFLAFQSPQIGLHFEIQFSNWILDLRSLTCQCL